MSIDFQGSLFGAAQPGVGPLAGRVCRTPLSRGAWLDVLPAWLEGADEVFAELVDRVPWRAERRQMWDSEVDVPRLLHMYGIGQELPHPALTAARDALDAYYADELGEPFVTAGCCYYRDGNDSVAWHGDDSGRGRTTDTMVAIVSLGSPRKLCLRPRGGQTEVTHLLGHGDLVVMGGSCQRTWEHAVPKTSRPVGPRISVQLARATSSDASPVAHLTGSRGCEGRWWLTWGWLAGWAGWFAAVLVTHSRLDLTIGVGVLAETCPGSAGEPAGPPGPPRWPDQKPVWSLFTQRP